MATAIVAFEGEGSVVRYAGNYSTYRTLRAERERALREEKAGKPQTPSSPPKAKAAGAKKSALTYAERIELEKMLPEIAEAEAKLEVLGAAANDPELFVSRRDEAPAKLAALEHQRAMVARLYARWEELEAKREG